jgi:hypothetical protein
MYCPHCLRKQQGFDYLFTEKFGICYDCVCNDALGVDERVPMDMANEILAMFDGVRVKYPNNMNK